MKRLAGALTLPCVALLLLTACSSGSPISRQAAPQAPTDAAPTPTALPPPPAAAVPAQRTAPPSAASRPYLEILKLQQSGATEQELLDKIRAENVRYQLTTAEILELRQVGVPEAVVAAMLRSGL